MRTDSETLLTGQGRHQHLVVSKLDAIYWSSHIRCLHRSVLPRWLLSFPRSPENGMRTDLVLPVTPELEIRVCLRRTFCAHQRYQPIPDAGGHAVQRVVLHSHRAWLRRRRAGFWRLPAEKSLHDLPVDQSARSRCQVDLLVPSCRRIQRDDAYCIECIDPSTGTYSTLGDDPGPTLRRPPRWRWLLPP